MDLDRAREILLDHSKNPRNRWVAPPMAVIPATPDTLGECRNPLCGDHVRVHLDAREGRITSCRLEIKGCTMCTASASMMSEQVAGLSVEAAEALRARFEETLLGSGDAPWPADLRPFEAFDHLRVSRARIPCALIPWYALKEAVRRIQ